jgi:ribonuclease HI
MLSIYMDGACRGNPGGPSSLGVVAYFPDEKTEWSVSSERLPNMTNNEAEYHALLRGLDMAEEATHSLPVREIRLHMDSLLVVSHVNQTWKCRAAHLQPLCQLARTKLAELAIKDVPVTLEHVPRERNARADELANEAFA